jgi:hypothetical protein
MPNVTAPLPDLVLYARAGCGLCDEARVTLTLVLDERGALGLPVPNLIERDITSDPELSSSPAKLRRLLESALDGVPLTR